MTVRHCDLKGFIRNVYPFHEQSCLTATCAGGLAEDTRLSVPSQGMADISHGMNVPLMWPRGDSV